MRNDESPIWLFPAAFVIFTAMFFTQPQSLENENSTFVLQADVWRWLCFFYCSLFALVLLGERVYEWKNWESDERRAFSIVIIQWSMVLAVATFGAAMVSAEMKTSVTGFYILFAIVFCGFGLFRLIRRRFSN